MQEFVIIPTYLIGELSQDKLYALIDFLSMADESGEVKASTPELMKRWNWGNTKVRNFINYLTEKELCKQETNKPTNKKQTNRQTKVFIINTDFLSLSQTKVQTRNKQANKQETNNKVDFNKEIYKRIIDYLNSRCGTRYTERNKQTKESIHARLEENFTEEDFYTVIDKKCNEWLGTEMERYLRPQTLFGTKFESYLNQKIVKEKGQTAQMLEQHYSMVDDWVKKKEMEAENNDF